MALRQSLYVRQKSTTGTRLTPQLTIKEYKDKDDDTIYHIDITSVASGLSTTQEDRTLDWKERPHADKIFGKVEGKSRLFKAGSYKKEGPATDFDQTFLQGKQLKDGTASKFLDDDLVQAWVKSVDGGNWQAEMVWGFEEIGKERRYTRRTVVWKGDKVQRCRLIYDYKGQADSKAEDDGLAYGEDPGS